MQLDRIPALASSPRLHGTPRLPPGVDTARGSDGEAAGIADWGVSRGIGWKEWAAIALACWSLLGQGEPCRVDPRFVSPDATLATYWEALRSNDGSGVSECFAEPEEAEPQPGMLWFLPPSRQLCVRSVRLTPIDFGQVLATYEVTFRPMGLSEEMRFIVGTHLVRSRFGWRITRAVDGAGMPEWRPIPRVVDI